MGVMKTGPIDLKSFFSKELLLDNFIEYEYTPNGERFSKLNERGLAFAEQAVNVVEWFNEAADEDDWGMFQGPINKVTDFLDELAYEIGSQEIHASRDIGDTVQGAVKKYKGEGTIKGAGTAPGTLSQNPPIDILKAYLKPYSKERAKLVKGKHTPTSYNKPIEGHWTSQIESGLDVGIVMNTTSGQNKVFGQGQDLYSADMGLLESMNIYDNDGNIMNVKDWTVLNPQKSILGYSNTGVFKAIFMDKAGNFMDRKYEDTFWHPKYNMPVPIKDIMDESNFNAIRSSHKQVYEYLYNVATIGEAQNVGASYRFTTVDIGNLDDFMDDSSRVQAQQWSGSTAFSMVGLASFKTGEGAANLGHYTKGLGYDPEQDAYYFSMTDIWDFEPGNYSEQWSLHDVDLTVGFEEGGYNKSGNRFVMEFDTNNDGTISSDEAHLIDVADPLSWEGNTEDETLAIKNRLDIINEAKERAPQKAVQASLMQASGQPINFYDRVYIPTKMIDDWFRFYGITPATRDEKIENMREGDPNLSYYSQTDPALLLNQSSQTPVLDMVIENTKARNRGPYPEGYDEIADLGYDPAHSPSTSSSQEAIHRHWIRERRDPGAKHLTSFGPSKIWSTGGNIYTEGEYGNIELTEEDIPLYDKHQINEDMRSKGLNDYKIKSPRYQDSDLMEIIPKPSGGLSKPVNKKDLELIIQYIEGLKK